MRTLSKWVIVALLVGNLLLGFVLVEQERQRAIRGARLNYFIETVAQVVSETGTPDSRQQLLARLAEYKDEVAIGSEVTRLMTALAAAEQRATTDSDAR